MWDKIKLEEVTSYRSGPKSKTNDRTKVILDMPTEVYSEFRKQIEMSYARDRRESDEKK